MLFIPVAILLIQVLASFLPKKTTINKNDNRPSVAILMPAHNEELVIAQSIETIKPVLQDKDRLVVVADNCTDDTAAIATDMGATVIERFNADKRGKGYALDFGLQSLQQNPPEIVMIVDADCMVDQHAIDRLSQACVQSERPIQALYLMESQPNPSLKARIATFAWHVKNKVRPLGYKNLGLPCQLMGTGMAFQWEDISKVSLASGHIVEDMKLGTDLARLNKAPLFLQDALVTSIFPPSEAATNTQRARWEHGHLSVIVNEAPKLIWGAIKNRNGQMLGMASDLLVPPLAMLTLMCLIIFGVSLLLGNTFTHFLTSALLASLLLAVFFSLDWVR